MIIFFNEQKINFLINGITISILLLFLIQTAAAYNNSTSGPAKNYPDIITIDTIENHQTGESFEIHGKTAQPVGQTLFIHIWPNTYRHATKAYSYPNRRPVYDGSTTVVRGSNGISFRSWSYTINTTDYDPDEYIVEVSTGDFQNPNGESEVAYQWFLLTPPEMMTSETMSVTQRTVSDLPTSSGTQSAPLPWILPIIAAGVIGLFGYIRAKPDRHNQ
jgi:hypothetical protein